MNLSYIDIIIIICYFAGVLYIGYRSVKKTKVTEEDFFLAGRSLTLPIFVMTLVSTWYGGILGVGEFSYRYGISNWITQGLPYYIFATIFAFFLAKKIRETNLISIPDKLEFEYDKKTALLGSFLTFILMTPSAYILMLSIFLQLLFGWSLMISLLVTIVIAISYLFWGGFRADIQTDVFEFFMMFIGFAIIIPFCVIRFGGFDFLQNNLPPLHLTLHGGNSIQYILVWFFVALWTLIDPAFHQRCYAAKDGKTAQKGILISIMFWFVFDFLTATAGLYARAALPNLSEPMMAYPMLAEEVLPPIAKGLFYVGILATIMSTLNTLAFVSAQTLGRDIILRLKSRKLWIGTLSNHELYDQRAKINTRYTQYGLVISMVLSGFLALAIPSVINIWYTIGSVIVPGLFIPLMAGYFPKLKYSTNFAFSSMLFGWTTSLTWFIIGMMNGNPAQYPLGIEPMYPGLIVSFMFWLMGKLHYSKMNNRQV